MGQFCPSCGRKRHIGWSEKRQAKAEAARHVVPDIVAMASAPEGYREVMAKMKKRKQSRGDFYEEAAKKAEGYIRQGLRAFEDSVTKVKTRDIPMENVNDVFMPVAANSQTLTYHEPTYEHPGGVTEMTFTITCEGVVYFSDIAIFRYRKIAHQL
jgi:hypothetical protein